MRETQLFNLADNPYEFVDQHHDRQVSALTGFKPSPKQTNLADDSRYAQKLGEMEALLLTQMRAHDDPYRLWNQPDDGLPEPKFRAPTKRKKNPGKK